MTASSSAFIEQNTDPSLKAAASASSLYGQNSSGKYRYQGKGNFTNGRPRNFYNPPHKVLK